MGYVINTIIKQNLSTEEKIRRITFALNFDWQQPPTPEIWATFDEIGLSGYVKDYNFTDGYAPSPYREVGIEEYDMLNWSPLFAAVTICDYRLVKWLIEHDATINRMDTRGMTAIFLAAQSGDLEIFRYLYEHGADLLHKKNASELGIHLFNTAIQYQKINIVAFMLDCPELRGADRFQDLLDSVSVAMHKKISDKIISMVRQRLISIQEENTKTEEKQHWAATVLQKHYRRVRIQRAYEAYITRPSIDALVEKNKFSEANRAMTNIKAQKKILGLVPRVRFIL